MLYLRVAHTNDEDEDLFKFNTLDEAVTYIKEEQCAEWLLSDDIVYGLYKEDDYTFVEYIKMPSVDLKEIDILQEGKRKTLKEFIKKWTFKKDGT